MDESLWPARNIAEFAYCPRLFYFMEVEGIHVPSEDTEQGNRVHRRVDKPSQEALPDGSLKPDPNRTVRSMTLTSHELQLTATMDLVPIRCSRTNVRLPCGRRGWSRRSGPITSRGRADRPWRWT